MIVTLAAVTAGIGLVAGAVTVGVLALLLRLLELLDSNVDLAGHHGEDTGGGASFRGDDEPPWWPDFERRFGAYLASLTAPR